MARRHFDFELQRLQNDMLRLGILVEKAVLKAADVLKRRDREGARQIIAGDRQLNKMRYDIENEALVLIATQQPMAGDLRTIATILTIAAEMERIGDYAKGIAIITLKVGNEPFVKPLLDLPRMAEKAADMLRRAMKAFVNRSVEDAKAISAEDREVDGLYDQVYRELMTYVIANPKIIGNVSHLLWAAHNLERAADRVVNICERVIFTVTGEIVELDEPHAEEEIDFDM